MPLNVRVRGADLPVLAVLCTVMSAAAFVALLIEHGGARWVGLVWMGFGVALYVGYRTSQGKPLLKRVTVPEAALTRRAEQVEYGSILVSILGTPLGDDIVQTAGRLGGGAAGGAAGRRGGRRGRGRCRDRGGVDLRGADGAAAGHAGARRRAQARAGGAAAGPGRRGGGRRHPSRHRPRARPPRRGGDRARG